MNMLLGMWWATFLGYGVWCVCVCVCVFFSVCLFVLLFGNSALRISDGMMMYKMYLFNDVQQHMYVYNMPLSNVYLLRKYVYKMNVCLVLM